MAGINENGRHGVSLVGMISVRPTLSGELSVPGGGKGRYYTPFVSEEGVLSWIPSDPTMPPVESVNIKGDAYVLTEEDIQDIAAISAAEVWPYIDEYLDENSVSINQGAENVGKYLIVGEDGKVRLSTAPGGDLPIATKTTLGGVIVGDNLSVDSTGRLSVTTTDDAETDNTLPITSSGVFSIVGNINALLETI